MERPKNLAEAIALLRKIAEVLDPEGSKEGYALFDKEGHMHTFDLHIPLENPEDGVIYWSGDGEEDVCTVNPQTLCFVDTDGYEHKAIDVASLLLQAYTRHIEYLAPWIAWLQAIPPSCGE